MFNWNKYQYKVTTQVQSQYSDILVDTSFQGMKKVFVVPFSDIAEKNQSQIVLFLM